MTRSEIARKIETAKAELPFAGVIHRRDLIKHIRRMEKELKTYDYYRERGRLRLQRGNTLSG